MTNLDMTSLPTLLIWNPGTEAGVDLAEVALEMRPTIERMMFDGIIEERESFGFALARPMPRYSDHWDHPSVLVALVVHWGPEGPRYAANACRKLRAAAREGMDTESIRLHYPLKFRDVVESQNADGSFPWGDFPYDGAAYVEVQGCRLLGAVSAYPKEQDPMVARFMTNRIGLIMFESDKKRRELTDAVV
jgi:hypothetical protein